MTVLVAMAIGALAGFGWAARWAQKRSRQRPTTLGGDF